MGQEAFEEGMQIPASAAAPPSETTVWAHWAVAGQGPWLCGIQAQLPLPGVMTGPLLVLWASLVSVELTRGLMATVVPGKGWTGVEEDGEGWEGLLACAPHPLSHVVVHSTKSELLPVLQGSQGQPVSSHGVPA